jgi:transposase
MEDDLVSKFLVADELWELVAPLLPPWTLRPKGGHPPVDNRVCLTGILFVLKTGIPWEDFPQELGCCGMTLWNRLHDWMRAGVWEKLHRLLLDKLRGADQIDFSRVIVDSSSVRAVHGGKKRAPVPWTGEKAAPNTTLSSMPAVCPWPPSSRRRIVMM